MIWNALFCRSSCVAAIVATAQPAMAQTLGQGVDNSIAWWRVVVALVFCILLAVAAALVLKARVDGRIPSPKALLLRAVTQNRRLQLIETLKVSPHLDICIIACDGRELLVAASAKGADILEQLALDSRGSEGQSA